MNQASAAKWAGKLRRRFIAVSDAMPASYDSLSKESLTVLSRACADARRFLDRAGPCPSVAQCARELLDFVEELAEVLDEVVTRTGAPRVVLRHAQVLRTEIEAKSRDLQAEFEAVFGGIAAQPSSPLGLDGDAARALGTDPRTVPIRIRGLD